VFTIDQITEQLRNFIVSRFADILANAGFPVLDLAANYDELGTVMTNQLRPEFEAYGLDLNKLLIENISVPPEVQEALDRRTSMGVVGSLSAYTQFQTANSIPDAAKNPGGLAAGGIGLGMGLGMASQMGQFLPPQGQPTPAGPGFFLAQGGQQAGPFDLTQLQEEARHGRLSRETLVWRQGMEQWTPAAQVAELNSILGQVPPPLPS
jgi:membrane protease subunit (stomatin/prohibitin family)